MDWTLRDNVVNDLFLCATLSGVEAGVHAKSFYSSKMWAKYVSKEISTFFNKFDMF